MTKYNNITSVLSISSPNIENCNKVADLLYKCKVASKINSNYTILRKNDGTFVRENGCTITIAGLKPKYIENDVWKPLQKEFDLKCAHLDILGIYKGCIYNFIHKQQCPT